MATVQTTRDVTIDEVESVLSDELGVHYRVTVDSNSTLKVGRTGVIPCRVSMIRRGDTTTFKISTTGLIVSRITQATSINPRVKRALEHAYSEKPAAQ